LPRPDAGSASSSRLGSAISTSAVARSSSELPRRRIARLAGSISRPTCTDALLATLPAREDRDPEAPLLPELDSTALRTAITRACKATGTPGFSPHSLRRRRGSLLQKHGRSLAEVAETLGDTKVVAAEHYVFALGDWREVNRIEALARLA
jgi:integrase